MDYTFLMNKMFARYFELWIVSNDDACLVVQRSIWLKTFYLTSSDTDTYYDVRYR